MTTLSYPNHPAGSDIKSIENILANFDAVVTWANGNVDANNMNASAAQSAGMNQSTQVVKGSAIIPASQGTASTVFTKLATPDQVTGVTVPTGGLIAVWFRAIWATSVSAAGLAAICVNDVPIQWDTGGAAPSAGAACALSPSFVNIANVVSSFVGGLNTVNSNTSYLGDVTTGQALADANNLGGPCYIFGLTAGVYTVSVQWRCSSGSLSASNRRLYVKAYSFV